MRRQSNGSQRDALDDNVTAHSRHLCNGASRNQATPTRITPPIPLGRASSGHPTSVALKSQQWLLAGLVGLVVAASAVGLVVGSAKVVLPLLFLCLGAATIGSRALRGLAQLARKLDQAQASEEKYKRLLLRYAPLPVWVGAVASDDEIEDNSNNDDQMRKAKTMARLRKAF